MDSRGIAVLVASFVMMMGPVLASVPAAADEREEGVGDLEAAQLSLGASEDLSAVTYSVVRFVGPAQPQWLEYVSSLGGRIIGYVPEDAYIVRIDEVGLAALGATAFVADARAYPPELKISPELPSARGELAVLVSLFPDATPEIPSVARRVVELGGEVERITPENRQMVIRVDAGRLRDMASIPQVAYVGSWGPPEADMNNVRTYVGAEVVHAFGHDGTGVVGEVMDNGILQTHTEFVNRLLAVDGAPPVDTANHGTSTFGIVFARGANANAEGMLPDIHPGPPVATGVFANWAMTRTQAANNLVNNWGGVFQSHSWGSGAVPQDRAYDALSQENDQIVFDLDITMTQSMGNFGHIGWARREAMAKNIISVGGLCHFDDANRGNDQWFGACSGQAGGVGPAVDGRIKPDLLGPFDAVWTSHSGGGYANFGGTSAATPVVAGSAGLVYDMYRANVFGNNPLGRDPHASTVKALLIANAFQYNLGTQAARCEQGWGTPDLAYMWDRRTTHFIVDEALSLQAGWRVRYAVTPQGTGPMKISLVWTDVPGQLAVTPHLVNNLDLMVLDPVGNLYWGNNGLTGDFLQVGCPGANPWSTTGGAADPRNNVENVFIQTPTAGTWFVWVMASSILMDGDPSTPTVLDQPFSLVVSSGTGAGDVQPPAPPTDLYSELSGTKADVVLTWTLSPNDPGSPGCNPCDVVAYDVYRRSGSLTGAYALVGSVSSGVTSWSHVGAGIDTANYFYAVAARDSSGLSTLDINERAGKFYRNLDRDNVLFSLPFVPKDPSTGAVMYSIEGDYCVRAYLPGWTSYCSFKPWNPLQTLDPWMGLWISNFAYPQPLVLVGKVPPSYTIPVVSGYNLVGYPTFNTDPTMHVALTDPLWQDPDVCYSTIEEYDPDSPPYYLKYANPMVETFRPGEGFWLQLYGATPPSCASQWTVPRNYMEQITT